MTNQEYHRLLGYWYAKVNRPRQAVTVTSRRSAKSQGNGTGIAIRTSRVQTQVPLEVVYRNETVHQRMVAEAR